MENTAAAPMLFPYEPEQFWAQMQLMIREEISKIGTAKKNNKEISYTTPGLTVKPLYKISEVCAIFSITRPTIYDWVKHGKLKPYKIQSRVYFLWNDIQGLMGGEGLQKSGV